MIDIKSVDLELQFLAAQAKSGAVSEIQKLLPAQMAALATSLGRKHDVKIQFGNFSTAATDGNTVMLPLTSKDNSWIVRGYLDHEIGHVRFTDFSVIPTQSAFRKTLWNQLEDVRIESRMGTLYPGMAFNYRALIRELRATPPGFFEIDQGNAPEVIMATYITLMLRSLYLRQAELADLALNARNVFIEMLGPDLELDLFSVIMKIADVNTPKGVLDLVDEIMGLLDMYATHPPQSNDDVQDGVQDPAQGQLDGSEGDELPGEAPPDKARDAAGDQKNDPGAADGDQGETNDAGHQVQDDAPPQTGDLANPEPSGDLSRLEADPAPDNSDIPGIKAAGQTSIQAAIQQALDSPDEIGDFGDQLRDLVQTKEYTGNYQYFEIARAASDTELQIAGYKPRPIKASSALVAGLSSRLRGLLQSYDLQRATPGMAGNRISRQRLHRIKTGDPRLFLRNAPQKLVHTALHLLVDNSASMDDCRRFEKAREVVLSLVKAMGPLRGMNLGMTIFPAYYPYRRVNGSVRTPVATVLRHNQKPGEMIMYPNGPNGQTPLAPAVRYVASAMLGLTEPRKILLILTDGEPDSSMDAEAAIQEAMSLGIEVVAMGIEQMMYPDIFPNFEIVRSIQDLPEKTFNLLEKLLTQR